MGALDGNYLNIGNVSEHFIATNSYYNDELTWCVQRSGQVPTWKKIFKLCDDPMVWLVHIITFISGIFMEFYLQQFECTMIPKWDWMRVVFNGLRMMCGYSIKLRPRIHAHRVYVAIACLSCIVYGITFCAIWLKCMTTPFFETQVQSVRDLLDKDFELVGDDFAAHLLMKEKQVTNSRICI